MPPHHPTPSLLAEDVVLVGLDPAGRLRLGDHHEVLVATALLVDLVADGHVEVRGTGAETRLLPVHPGTAPAHPVLRDALARLAAAHAPPTAADLAEVAAAGWLIRKAAEWELRRQRERPGAPLGAALPGFRARDRVVAHLVDTGVLLPRRHRTLGLLPSTRYAVQPPSRRDDLVATARAVLLDGREADERTARVLALLGVVNVFASVLNGAAHLARWAPRPRRTGADERARALAGRDGEDPAVTTLVGALRVVVAQRNERSSS